MLTFGCRGAVRNVRFVACIGAAFVLPATGVAIFSGPAQAQEVTSGGCIGGWNAHNCVTRWGPENDPFVRPVPQPDNAADRARAIQRDRRWADRCHPVLRQDRYGVARYRYAAPGCEFGVGEY